MRFARFAAVAAAATILASCSAKSDGDANTSAPAPPVTSAPLPGVTPLSPSSPPRPTCASDTLQTKSKGELTIATDSPAYEPWFVDNKPSNGKGFESAVAFAVAKQLGYSSGEVHWTTEPFNNVTAPTPKKFDFDINEVSITAKRAQAVDFSTGYYDVAQAIVTLKNSKYADATSVADFKNAKLAAQKGTTSFDAINDVIKPSATPAEFPTNILAVQALKNGQVDGLVVDLPTAFYVTSAQVQDAKIAGQLPVGADPEQFGLVLEKDSPITDCVSAAVDLLRANGTLTRLQHTWLASAGGAPELK
jgi:polar amino acid transport system substrate-binding protein